MTLRNIAFFMMGLAIMAAVFMPGKEETSPEQKEKVSEFQVSSRHNFYKYLIYQIVMIEQAQAKDQEGARESIKKMLIELESGVAADQAERIILLERLGQTLAEDEFGLAGSFGPDLRKLLVSRKALAPDSLVFGLAGAPLLSIRQARLLGDEKQAAEIEADLLAKAKKFTAIIAGISALILLLLGVSAGLVYYVLRNNTPQFLRATRTLSVSEKKAALESITIFFFIVFPVGRALSPSIEADSRLYAALLLSGAALAGALWHYQRHATGKALLLFVPEEKEKGWVFRDIAIGLSGFIAIVPVALVLLFLTFAVSGARAMDVKGAHPIVFELDDHLALSIAMAVLVAPIAEEIIFRSFIYSAFGNILRMRWAIALTGLFFAALHPQTALAMPYLVALGGGLCLVREYSASVLAPIVTHALANGMALGLFFLLS